MAALFIVFILLLVTCIHSSIQTQNLLSASSKVAHARIGSFAKYFDGLAFNEQNILETRSSTARFLASQQLKQVPILSQNNSFSCNQNFTTSVKQGKLGDKTCNYSSLYYCQPTNTFLHLESSYIDIFPGSVLISQYLNGVLDGSESQVPLSQGSNYRNTNITIYDYVGNKTFSQKYNNAEISKRISQVIKSNTKQNQNNMIYFDLATTDDLPSLARFLSFSKATLKKLGISRTSASLTSFKKKIIFIYTKPIATFNIVINEKSTPLNTFYSSDLPNTQFDQLTSPPVYIDSVTYGSIIIFTVDYNDITSKLFEKLNTTVYANPAQAQPILNAITSQPSLKVFSRGPFSKQQINAIKAGNWLDYILPTPSNMANMIHPLFYSVRNFNKEKYFATNQFDYVTVCDCL